MNRSETALILAKVQAFDRRTVGDVDVAAWQEALADIDPALASDAVTAHFRASTDWLMPHHIRTHVRAVELQRLRDAGPPDYPSGLDQAQERRYRELWQEQVRRGATGPQATAQVDQLIGHTRGRLADHDVTRAIDGMFSTRRAS